MGLFTRKKTEIREGGVAFVQKGSTAAYNMIDSEDSDKRVEKFQKYRRAYERVPLITAIVDVQADQVVQEFYFEGPNKKELTKFADDNNLIRFFHRTTKSMLIYGNSYTEVVKSKKSGKILELKILNPIWMDVYRKDNGDVIGYAQTIENKKLVLWGTTGKPNEDAKFTKRIPKIDSILHFKYNVLGSEKYGRSIIEPLLPSVQSKLDMELRLGKIIDKYIAPLIWAKVGNNEMPASSSVVTEVSQTLRDLQAESEVTTSHLVDLQVLDFNNKGMDIKTPIEHMDQEIITGGQTPPVLLGRTTSTTSDAEVQLRNFGRHIKSIQRELKFEFEDLIIVGQDLGSSEDKLIWEKSEEREWEIDVDILRGLVTDGVLTAQKANDLLPPKYRETLPEPIDPMMGGTQTPRPNQMKTDKVTNKPNDPTQTTKNKNTLGKRVKKTDREVPIK